MYFIKYHPLKEKLKHRKVTDRQALPYFLVFVGLISTASSFHLVDEMNRWDILSGILRVGVAIAGVIYAYFQNGGSRGYDLIQKYVVLGWVVSVRVILFFIPILIIFYIITYALGIIVEATSDIIDVMILFLFEVILYQRIGRHIKDTHDDKLSGQVTSPATIGRSAPGAR